MRLQLRILILASMAVISASACGGNDPASATAEIPAPTTTTTTLAPTTTAPATTTTSGPAAVRPALVIWTDGLRARAVQDLTARFTQDTGLAVRVVVKDFVTIRDDVLALGKDPEGPDLFIGAHDWTGALVDAGVVAPMDDLPASIADDFYENAFTGFRIDRTTYGLPFQFEAVAMWMNTTLAGTLEAPSDFEAVRTMCDRVVDENAGQICLSLPGGSDSSNAYHQFPFVGAFNGSVFSFDPAVGYTPDQAGIDSAAAVEGTQFMEALAVEEYMPSLNYLQAEEAFTTGAAMFWMTGPWAHEAITQGSAASGFEYQAVPIPMMGGHIPRPFYEARGFFVRASSDRVHRAKQLLYDHFATVDGMTTLYLAGSPYPTHRAVAAAIENPTAAVFAHSATLAQPTPNIVEMTSQIWDLWGESLADIRNQVAPAQQVLEAAGATIEGMLK